MAYKVEVTDTFGGEANYCWVHRHRIEVSEKEERAFGNNPGKRNRTLVRRAKALEGWTGHRCEVDANGYDTITVRPRGAAMVMFIDYDDSPQD